MKQTREQGQRRTSGFTLIEILVVAALISLFAGLAMFSVETFTTQSKRKAAQADARGLGDALDVAHFQFGFYPKPCFLSMSSFDIDGLKVVDERKPDVWNLPNFDVIGFGLVPPISRRVITDWTGPFLPAPTGRAIGAKGGVCRMRMPGSDPVKGPFYDWPADPWGNPYVVYLMGITKYVVDGQTQSGPARIGSPTQQASYFARVVSYGPNGIPGGRPRLSDGLKDSQGNPLNVNMDVGIRRAAEQYMLYKKEGDHFVALAPEEYETLFGTKAGPGQEKFNRMAAIRQELGYMDLSVSEIDSAFKGQVPGIMDPGSDDLTAPLH